MGTNKLLGHLQATQRASLSSPGHHYLWDATASPSGHTGSAVCGQAIQGWNSVLGRVEGCARKYQLH